MYPFVDTETFYPSQAKQDYFLVAGRLHSHKRVDLVVDVFSRLGWQLHVVGGGRAEAELQAQAGAHENILFTGRIDDEELREEFSGAKGLIFPQEEDFGIIPLEAMACGTPVLAYGAGGALETVTPETGMFFAKQDAVDLEEAVRQFAGLEFSSEALFDRAEEFSRRKFQDAISAFVEAHGQHYDDGNDRD